MALVKGKFVDKDQLIQANSDPVDEKDLARKAYVDSAAASAASSAVDAKVIVGPMEIAFGSPDGTTLDRSEFLTYDASIGFFLNVGGQMATRSLAQDPADPQSLIVNDKVEVFGDDGTGPAYSRLKRDYVEAKKVLPTKELSASLGFDGVDSWLGVSETTNAGNNISMSKIFPNKAQLFTIDLSAGTGPQPILPVEQYDLVVKKYVDDGLAAKADASHTHVAADITDFASAAEAALADELAAKQDSLGTGTTSQYLRGDLTWQEIVLSYPVAQVKHVSKNGVDATADGSEEKPYLTISAAMAAITDASPTKRYVVRVAAGSYTEASLALKANVFVIGESKESVRITGAVSLDASFSGSGDNRSGFSMITLLSAADFNWATVTSAAGKLYMNEVVFGSTVNMYGHNNAIAQAQFDSCVIFGALTISGINVGVFTNNICYGNITLNQHPNGGMASILAATGGSCSGTVRFNTTVSDFGRRCSGFLKAFNCENLIIDGPSSYADVDLVSQGKSSTQKLNGGNLVALNPKVSHDLETQMLKPLANNAHNSGDWGKQWFFNFAYVHASAGTDMYLTSVMENYDPAGDTTGRSVFIQADGYGLQSNVSGGNIELETAAVSGTGVRGKVQIKAKELDMTNTKIRNLANATDSADAVNKGQLDFAISSIDLSSRVAKSGDTMSGALAMGSNKITGLANGVDSGDAVNKGQLDAAISGIDLGSKIEDSITDGVTDKAPSQNAVYDALALKLDQATKGAANGVAELDGSGKIPTSQLPALAVTDTFVVASEALMLALTAEKGDVAIRTDLSKSFILAGPSAAVLADWKELLTPGDAVVSVNGQTGSVSLDTDDIAEGTTNKYFSDAAAKAAAVVNSTAGSETDQAASVDAMKSYVSAEIAAIPAPQIPQGKKERIVLTATDISNGYIDCAFEAMADTMMVMTGGVVHNEGSGDDYTLSVVAGKTRITFEPDLAAILADGDDIYLQYLRLV